MAQDNEYPVPPLEVDKALLKNMPPALQALNRQARKELRSKARAKFKATHGIKKTNT